MKRTYHLNTIPIVPILSTLGILSICSIIAFSTSSVSAVTEKSDIDVQFTFNDVLSVSLSSPNLVISDLAPGTSADSNIITVTVSSNNPYGYTLNSTVGSTTYTNRNLTHSSSASATPFSSINYGTTVADLSSFSPNQWGYSFSTDNGTTWINSNKTDGTTNDTGYSGLPFYTDTENITTLKESSTTSAAAGDSIQFKIAAKADATQLSGEYNNIINFVLTGSPAPEPSFCDTHTCMQNLDSTSLATLLPNVGDTATVYDARDEEDYLIGKLADNKYWMLDNLRLDPTAVDLATLQGNTNASNTTLNYLKGITTRDPSTDPSGKYATAGVANWTSSYSYSAPLINATDKNNATTSYGVGSGKIGVYYNYCAASAGSYCYGNGTSAGPSSGDATEDICPAGWRLPTGGGEAMATNNEFNNLALELGLFFDYELQGYSGTIYQTALSTPMSGYFYNGSAKNQGTNGYFWSSTRDSNYEMYNLSVFDDGDEAADPTNRHYRYYGFSVRCLASS